eukprot:5404938-Amphidinium_carterae.1
MLACASRCILQAREDSSVESLENLDEAHVQLCHHAGWALTIQHGFTHEARGGNAATTTLSTVGRATCHMSSCRAACNTACTLFLAAT